MGLIDEDLEEWMLTGGGSSANGPDKRTPYQKRMDAQKTLDSVIDVLGNRLAKTASVSEPSGPERNGPG